MIAEPGSQARYQDLAWTALRVVIGFLIVMHGMQKLFGVLADHPQPPVGSQMWIGGLLEFVGGILVGTGLFTRIAAFVLAGEMAVAYFQFHWKFQTGDQFFPIANHGELAVLMCFAFLAISAIGAGPVSLDRLRSK